MTEQREHTHASRWNGMKTALPPSVVNAKPEPQDQHADNSSFLLLTSQHKFPAMPFRRFVTLCESISKVGLPGPLGFRAPLGRHSSGALRMPLHDEQRHRNPCWTPGSQLNTILVHDRPSPGRFPLALLLVGLRCRIPAEAIVYPRLLAARRNWWRIRRCIVSFATVPCQGTYPGHAFKLHFLAAVKERSFCVHHLRLIRARICPEVACVHVTVHVINKMPINPKRFHCLQGWTAWFRSISTQTEDSGGTAVIWLAARNIALSWTECLTMILRSHMTFGDATAHVRSPRHFIISWVFYTFHPCPA